eukprot:gnl/MRDRNA2_/MRDRNA2_86700_c0_seq4.p1 gnl/MRDRNA2_/MRDRNA2_86700_c0~~gnl/MRDRNA2_/MRDRNA2_86700_c0_seq4.p1  ORF type:complete len:415 (+),score=72.21 gnl/MRDRNA2_/MRDRNA2_86700_c0_seq4:122-1366(+)
MRTLAGSNFSSNTTRCSTNASSDGTSEDEHAIAQECLMPRMPSPESPEVPGGNSQLHPNQNNNPRRRRYRSANLLMGDRTKLQHDLSKLSTGVENGAAHPVLKDAGAVPLEKSCTMCGRKVLQQIGAGAFGKVYETENLSNGTKEVMKTVAKSTKAAQEAIILAELPPHDNLIQQYHWAASTRTIYIFLQHGGSFNLYSFLKAHYLQKLELDVALDLWSHAVKGILHMHNYGVCHLDIKPENLMMGDDRVLRVADFGTASYTREPIVYPKGSLPFAAPEVLDTFKNRKAYLGHLADTFSLGVLFFEMCFGLGSMEKHLGWTSKRNQDLISDPDARAEEMREVLSQRTIICKEELNQVATSFDTKPIEATLNATLCPDLCSRLHLSDIFSSSGNELFINISLDSEDGDFQFLEWA